MDLSKFCRDGKFLMLAFDHRGSFKKLMNPDHPEMVSDQQAIDLKKRIIDSVADQFSSILVDADFGLAAYTSRDKPFLLPIEQTGYQDEYCRIDDGCERVNKLEFSVPELIEKGAKAVKILIYFNPYYQSAKEQLATSEKVLKQCQEFGVPLFLEIVTYQMETEHVARSKMILDSLDLFLAANIRPDVFKLEYPGDYASCEQISQKLGSTPWILLTRGVSFDEFVPQIADAIRAGARGFLAGRALWQEACAMTEPELTNFLNVTLPARFSRIAEICIDSGVAKVGDLSIPLENANLGKKVLIYSNRNCPDTTRIKKFLTENAIEFEYIDYSKDKSIKTWIKSFAKLTPVLFMLDGTILYSPSNTELFDYFKMSFGGVNNLKSMQEPKYDTIIIGGGPAGITAAIYAARKSLKVLLLTKDVGGQAALSGDIENYPGFSMITGFDLAKKFKEDIERFDTSVTGFDTGLWIKNQVEVDKIMGIEGDFRVSCGKQEYRSSTVIIATGRVPRMLGIPGEKEFLGKGVATCATCDAPFYRGKNVAVIGGGNSALDATVALMKIAKSVTILNATDALHGDAIMLANIAKEDKVQIKNKVKVKEIKGSKFVEQIVFEVENQEMSLDVDGVFVEIGWSPAVDFLSPEIKLNERREIVVDEFGKTSVEGIYACGDVNNLWGEQIIIAAGEGAKTALVVAEHVAKIPHQATSNPHEG